MEDEVIWYDTKSRPCANCESYPAQLVIWEGVENDLYCSLECFEEDQGVN